MNKSGDLTRKQPCELMHNNLNQDKIYWSWFDESQFKMATKSKRKRSRNGVERRYDNFSFGSVTAVPPFWALWLRKSTQFSPPPPRFATIPLVPDPEGHKANYNSCGITQQRENCYPMALGWSANSWSVFSGEGWGGGGVNKIISHPRCFLFSHSGLTVLNWKWEPSSLCLIISHSAFTVITWKWGPSSLCLIISHSAFTVITESGATIICVLAALSLLVYPCVMNGHTDIIASSLCPVFSHSAFTVLTWKWGPSSLCVIISHSAFSHYLKVGTIFVMSDHLSLIVYSHYWKWGNHHLCARRTFIACLSLRHEWP